jgi:arginine deiminase
MSLSIQSETGRLESVMVHLPGAEIDHMVPSMMEQMLFDDILFGQRAREEHRRLQRLLSLVADEVVVFSEVFSESLEQEEARTALLRDLEKQLGLSGSLLEQLRGMTAAELAKALVEGLLDPALSDVPERAEQSYLLLPLPNLFFHRDPAMVVGNNVIMGSMATLARLREPLLMHHLFHHHSRFARSNPLFYHFDADFSRRSTARPRPALEGGDVLVPRADTLLIGNSVRTSRRTIEELACTLKQQSCGLRRILVVDIPKARSFMHLDTVFTVISEHECLVYGPAIVEGGVEQSAVYEVDLERNELSFTAKESLLSALRESGIDLEPVLCGGSDPIAQQREQWTDGANAFALAPGVIMLYRRNLRTVEELSKRGYEVIEEDQILLGRVEPDLGPDSNKRYVMLLADHELSRARGGAA